MKAIFPEELSRPESLSRSLHPENAREMAFVGLGANLGDRMKTLTAAHSALAALSQTRLVRCSSFYSTSPVDAEGPDYINAVAQLETDLGPLELLHALQSIEKNAGRTRPGRNAPRTLDLDLLLYGTQVLHGAELTLPHPRMFERAFVLLPLEEIAPGLVPAHCLHAVSGQDAHRLGM